MKAFIFLCLLPTFTLAAPSGRALTKKYQCLQCHKPSNSLNAPLIHGMHEAYMVTQLKEMRDGKRQHNMMRNIVYKISDEEIQILAQHFNAFKRCSAPMQQVPAVGDVANGKAKSLTCAACHVPNSPTAAPVLDGQNSHYLIAQLKAYKKGERTNAVMAPLAKILTDKDVIDVAAYYSGLPTCK